jgi:hypothetical protein
MNAFDRLAPLLVAEIPKALAALKLKKPICTVRIYYYDTHAMEGYILLKTLTVEGRAEIVAKKGRNAPFYLWASGEEAGEPVCFFPPEGSTNKVHKQIAKLFEEAYELLTEDEHEDENMDLYRQMLVGVVRQLNQRDWSDVFPVSDDFAVAPADGDQHFADDYADLAESIPAERLELLREHGFLGPEGTWDQLP